MAQHNIEPYLQTQVRERLISACTEGNLKKIEDLLIFGGDPCARINDWTALHRAAEHETTDALETLFESGNVKDVDVQMTKTGTTPLQNACQVDLDTSQCVKFLIEKGASVTKKDSEGYTALHYAARRNNSKVLKVIIDLVEGINVDLKSNFGTTPLMNACHYGSLDCMKLLVQNGAKVTERDKLNNTTLHCAVWSGNVEKVKECLSWPGIDLNAVGDRGQTPLIRACEMGHVEVVSYLLNAGADISIRDSEGFKAEYYGIKKLALAILLYNHMKKKNSESKSRSKSATENVPITTVEDSIPADQITSRTQYNNTNISESIHSSFWDESTIAQYSNAMAEFSRTWIEQRLQSQHQLQKQFSTKTSSIPAVQKNSLPADINKQHQTSYEQRDIKSAVRLSDKPKDNVTLKSAIDNVRNLIQKTFEIFTEARINSILSIIERNFDFATGNLSDLSSLKETLFTESNVLKGTEAAKLIKAFKEEYGQSD